MRSVTTITVTYNSERTLRQCLQSIVGQDYPEELLEVLVVDGGSRDNTLNIAKSLGARIIHEDTGSPEGAKSIGLSNARNQLIAFIASDNILPHKNWMKIMVEPFDQDEKIIATQPLRYAYRCQDTPLNRYFALFGVNDPVPYYLDKRDRLSWMEDEWSLPAIARDMGNYYRVRFTPANMPTLGDNGFIIRKEILMKARCSPEEYFHIDVNYDLVKLGFDTYGIVKTDILHVTGERFFNFFRKRMRYMEELYLRDSSRRRYKIYKPAERWKLIKYIVYSLTLVEPTFRSIKGYLRIRDWAWFLHPLMCWIMMVVYGYVTVKWQVAAIRRFIQRG